MTVLTIFTAPKPFTHLHIDLIQRNAIRSWLALGDAVEVLLIGNEEGMAEAAAELGVRQLAQVKCNRFGTPLISSIFELARQNSQSPLLAYVNADILLMPDFVAAAQIASRRLNKFLLIGQRWDLHVSAPISFEPGWEEALRRCAYQEGKLHPPAGSDYFIFPQNAFRKMPDFAIGRAGWDNWMIYWARRQGWATIDATPDVFILHQHHDYFHLPGGQPHYRLPESDQNVQLAGGRMITRFMLADCNWRIVNGKITRQPLTWKRFWREVEIFPLVSLHSRWLGRLFYFLFHPYKRYSELRSSSNNHPRKEV